MKLVLRDKFVAGNYLGKSNHINPKPGDERPKAEEFTIEQNIFGAIITGKSSIGGVCKSTWTGKLYKVEGFKFFFAIDLAFAGSENGIMDLTIQNDRADGFYKCADPGYEYAFEITATSRTRSR